MSNTAKQQAIDAACPGCSSGEWGADGMMVVTPPPEVGRQAIDEIMDGRRTEPFTSRRIARCDPSAYVSQSQAEANTRIMGAAKDLLAVAKAYEAWEAKLVLADAACGGSLPRMTQELCEEFLEIQWLRNAAVRKAMEATP